MKRPALLIAVFLLGIAATAADALPLRAKGGTKPWTGCCSHCSGVQCSGCNEIQPDRICHAFRANCTTVDDETKCKPSEPKAGAKLKAR
jgi:hypothetical protein